MSEQKPPQRQPMAPRDLSGALQDAPRGAWAAFSKDRTRVVASSESIEEAIRLAYLSGGSDPLLILVPPAEEGITAGVE